MRAARWHGRRDVRIEDLPDLGAPGPGWVRLRIEVCGICGTDVEEYFAGPIVIPLKPNPLSGRSAPLTLGHESVGVVEEVGEGVTLEPGTRVAVESNMFCGECFWCKRGEYPLCPKLSSLGQGADGGLAEQMLAPAFMCLPYGAHVPAEEMAFAEPLSVAVRAVRRAGVGDGSTVGIVGAGTIGLLALQYARIAGASKVVIVESHEHRRKLALKLGADAAVSPAEAGEAALQLTGGIGLDATIEAAGNPTASESAVRLARPGGRAVLLGVYDDTIPIDMMDLLLGEKEIFASLSHVYNIDFSRAVELLDRGEVEVSALISDRISLDQVVTDGFEALRRDGETHLKILVFPQPSALG